MNRPGLGAAFDGIDGEAGCQRGRRLWAFRIGGELVAGLLASGSCGGLESILSAFLSSPLTVISVISGIAR